MKARRFFAVVPEKTKQNIMFSQFDRHPPGQLKPLRGSFWRRPSFPSACKTAWVQIIGFGVHSQSTDLNLCSSSSIISIRDTVLVLGRNCVAGSEDQRVPTQVAEDLLKRSPKVP